MYPLRIYVPKRGTPLRNYVPGFPPGCTPKVKNVFCFKLDAMSAPESLETTIRILLMFSIALAHRRGTVARAPQPARERLLTTPAHAP